MYNNTPDNTTTSYIPLSVVKVLQEVYYICTYNNNKNNNIPINVINTLNNQYTIRQLLNKPWIAGIAFQYISHSLPSSSIYLH